MARNDELIFGVGVNYFLFSASPSSPPFSLGIMWYITGHYAALAFDLDSVFNAFMIAPYRRGLR